MWNPMCILLRQSMGRSPNEYLGGGGGLAALAEFINSLITFCILSKDVILCSWLVVFNLINQGE